MSDKVGEIRFAVPPPPGVNVRIAQSDEVFPVRRIYCVGRNYADHVREMGGDERDPPFFFQKPTDAITPSGAAIPYPPATQDFQHEVELVLAIGKGGRDIAASDAAAHVFGFAVGVDLTRRDLQAAARKAGRPWEIGKAFDASAPIGPIRRRGEAPLLEAGRIELRVNGQLRQEGDLAQMIWGVAEVVSQLSSLYALRPGDLVYTGTPAGVGPLTVGDEVLARVDGLDDLAFTIG